MGYLGRNPAIGTQKVLDGLESQFNGTLTTFDLRYNGTPTYPTLSESLIVSLGGVLQEPGEAYTVASDTITFASAPPAGTDCWILLYSEFGGAAGATTNLTVGNNLAVRGATDLDGDIDIDAGQITYTASSNIAKFADNAKLIFGEGDDLQIYHDGSISYISDQGTGALRLLASDFRVRNAADTEQLATFTQNGAVTLFHDNSEKFATTTTGATVTGTALATALSTGVSGTGINISTNTISGPATLTIDPAAIGDDTGTVEIKGNLTVQGTTTTVNSTTTTVNQISLGDNDKALFGDGDDLQIYHSGVNSFIRDQGTGSLFIEGTDLTLRAADSTTRYLVANETNGDVSLFYGNSAKFATTTTGVNITGTLKVNNIASLDSTTLSLGLEGGADGFINTQESLYVNIDSNNDETGKRFEIRHGATDASGTQLFTVLDSGNVGIGTTHPDANLEVVGSSTGEVELARFRIEGQTNNPMLRFFSDESQKLLTIGTSGSVTGSQLAIDTSGSEAMRIDSSGNVGIGTSSPLTKLAVSGNGAFGNTTHLTNNLIDSQTSIDRTPQLQINGTSGPSSGIGLISWHSSGGGYYSPQLWLAKSNGSVGSNVVVTNGTDLGAINFAGNDGASFLNAASIRAEVDGTPGSNDMPGRLVFYTTADGASSPTEHLRIASSGNVGIGTSSPSEKLDIFGNIAVTGTVDGRDIATDGTKLDGIESGATGDQSAAEILTAIKTVDGTGSGLDADLLDGIQASSFLRSDADDTTTGDITFRDNTLFFDNTTFSTFDWGNYQADSGDLIWTVTGTGGPEMELESDGSNYSNAELKVGGSKVWTAGNDGSGSGLDADLLDGIDSGSFLRSDAADTASGFIHLNGGVSIQKPSTCWMNNYFGVGTLGQLYSAGSYWTSLVSNGYRNSSGNWTSHAANSNTGAAEIDLTPDGNIYFRTDATKANGSSTTPTLRAQINSSGVFSVGGNTVWHAGNDGAGTGLDADTVDGIQAASFLRSDVHDASAPQRIEFKGCETNNYDTIATSTGSQGGIEIYNTGSGNDAFMAFHAEGDFACYFGLDADSNSLAVGGWSMGANKYKVWHAGNDGSGSGLDADTLDGQQGSYYATAASVSAIAALDPVITLTGAVTGTGTMTNLGNVSIATTATADPVLTLAGDATGSATFTNLGNATLTVAIVDDSHNHVISNVDGLQTALNAKLASSSYTAADVLTKIKTVDGAGSGLDADLLDGISSASFLRSDASDTFTTLSGTTINLGSQVSLVESSHRADLLAITSSTTSWGGITIANSSGETLTSFMGEGNSFGIYDDLNNEWALLCTENSEVRIYHDGSEKLATTSGGIDIVGNITLSGTVDGRDIASDGSKLDGIAAGANNYSFPYTVSALAGNNTVVQRHSNGYIYANYFNGTGTFSTTGATSGMGIFTGTNGTDTFGRSYTAAAARTLLNVENGATADQTAAEILTAIKTVDGSGSGLDADLLDGISSASFLRSNAADSFTGVLTSNINSTGAIVLNKTVATHYAGIAWHEVGDLRWLMYVSNNADGTFNLQVRKNGTDVKQVFSVNQSTGIINFNQSSATIASNTIWHAGNDGAGTGLDADTLDGVNSGSFLRSNAADQKTSGTLRFNDNVILSLGSGDDAEFFVNGSHLYLDLNSEIGNFYIRDGSTTRYTFNDNGSFTATGNVTANSDIKLKDNIEPIANPLDKINQINGVTFDRIDIPELGRQMGVIAQDVEKVCPELVSTDDEGTKSVAYGNMVGLLIEAIKEQQALIEALTARIEALENP